ncbi:gefF [Symbiodinium natans]|uniref:GefF protein n=1 Tax=Symbiodinium natans TaxID=878477 RepID=A0A812SW65_9DINO|nr:gefF [Symbiodinium natans]
MAGKLLVDEDKLPHAELPGYGHTAVVSPDGHCMLVYGGWVAQENVSRTLWCYNMTADKWQDTSATNSPTPRLGHSAVMANDNCMYVFGGYLGAANSSSGYFVPQVANDWQCYNVQTNAWTEITPTGDVPLEPRYQHTAVLAQDCIYIFGGINGTQFLSELGCFNIVSHDYTLLEPGTGRMNHAAALAPSFDCMVVWGGQGQNWMLVNDGSTVESYNYKEGAWERRNVTSQYPEPRAGARAVYVPQWDAQLFFGGYLNGVLQADFWVFVPGNTTTSTTTTSTTFSTTTSTFTTTEQAQNSWVQLEPVGGNGPVGRDMFSMVLRESDGVVLVFGGFSFNFTSGIDTIHDDLWLYSTQGNFWLPKTSCTSPSFGHSAVLSPDGQCMLVYGGWVAQLVFSKTLWCYNLTADAWQDTGATNSPAPRFGHTAVMASDNCMYVFGGDLGPPNVSTGGYVAQFANDWLCYNVQTNAWTEITPTGDVPIEPRYQHTAVLVQDCIYIFGGWNSSYVRLPNLECFNIVTREQTLLDVSGIARTNHGVALMPSFDCMMVWGGTGPYFSTPDVDDSVRCYNYQAGSWELRNGTLDQFPQPRYGARGVYVPQWDMQLFFGGYGFQTMQYYNELWVFRAGPTTTSTTTTLTSSSTATFTFTATEQARSSWVQLVPYSGATPPARRFHSAVFTNRTGVDLMVVYAGHDETSFLGDLWLYAVQANLWVQKASTAILRLGHTAVMSPVNDCMIIFGGETTPGLVHLNDQWCYNTSADFWSEINGSSGSAPSPRAHHRAVVNASGLVFYSGGYAQDLHVFEIHRYSIQDNSWSGSLALGNPGLAPRHSHTAVLIGDCMYIYGGRWETTSWPNLVCFNVQTSEMVWLTSSRSMWRHAAAWAPQADCMVLFGGMEGDQLHYIAEGPICYAYLDDSFSVLPLSNPLVYPGVREGLTAVHVPEPESVLVFGGYDGTNPLNDLWSYRALVPTTTTTASVSSSTSTSSSTSSSTLTFTTTNTSMTSTSISTSLTSTTSTSETATTSTGTSVTSTSTRTRGTNVTEAFLVFEASQALVMERALEEAKNSSQVVTAVSLKEYDGSELLAAAIRTEDVTEDVVLELETASVAIPGDLSAGSASLATLGEGGDVYSLVNDSLNGTGLVLASPPLKIDLWDANGDPIKGELPAPLKFNLTAGNASDDPGAACMFWDEDLEEWSSRGVSTLAGGEDGSIACATTHLSLFAIIINTIISTLVCSNAAAIFSLEGLQSLLTVTWMTQLPSILNWTMITVGIVLLAIARKRDRQEQQRLQKLQRTVDACALCRGHREKENHGVVEDLKQNCTGMLNLNLTRSISSVVVRHKTGVSLDQLDRVHRLGGRTVTHDLAKLTLKSFERMGCLSKLFLLYRINCQFLRVLDPRMTSTSLQRTAVVMARVYSGWAVSATFYGATSLAPDQPDCEPKEGLVEKIVRSVVIAWITTLVGAMPLAALIAIVQKVFIIPVRIRMVFFWTFLIAYFVLCLMVVCIFIASVSPSDSEKWFISSLTNVLQATFLSPLLIASMMYVWLQCRQYRRYCSQAVGKWQSESDSRREVRLENISLTDAALKQLLGVKSLDLARVAVTCEVAGREEVVTLEENKGSYRSPVHYKLDPNQVLIISVYKVQMKRLDSHLSSKASLVDLAESGGGGVDHSGESRKLVASAFVEVGQLQDGGFNGELPLYGMNKRKLKVAMEAQVASSRPGEAFQQEKPRMEPENKAPLLSQTAVTVAVEKDEMEDVLEVVPASESPSEDEESMEVPQELMKPILIMSLQAPDGSTEMEEDEEEECRQAEHLQASSHSGMQMKEGSVQLAMPPPMEASSHSAQQMTEVSVQLAMPPPMEEPPFLKPDKVPEPPSQATLANPPVFRKVGMQSPKSILPEAPAALDSRKVVTARTPRTQRPNEGEEAGRSVREELAEQAAKDPDLSDLIKAAENRFRGRSPTPSPRAWPTQTGT